MSAVYASNEIFFFCFHCMCLLYPILSHLQLNVSVSIKTEHVSGQSPTAKLNSAVNKMPHVYMLCANCSLKSM